MLKAFVFLGLLLLAVGSDAQLTQAGKDFIVSAHNKLRSTIALGKFSANGDIRRAATNMKMVSYDTTIEKYAWQSIQNCPATISTPANTGSNIRVFDVTGTALSADEYAKQALAEWENQFQVKGWPVNNTVTADLAAQGLKQATQMAFSLTGSIGCAAQKCGSKVAVVCHYKSPLVNDQPVYQMGTVCSRCPDFYVCNQPTGLCAYQQSGK